jgi:hypothetical protein
MHINFQDLAITEQPRRLTYTELNAEKIKLLRELIDDDVDLGLVQMVHHLIDDAQESGYYGGYSDAHWYAKGIGDGA